MPGCEQEAGEMVEGFHWPAESLLADKWECVGIINDDKTECIWFRMNALTEVVYLVTNRVNTTVFFGAEPENRFNGEGRLLFQNFDDIFQEGRLSRAWGSSNENMRKVGHHFSYRCEDSVLTI